MMRHGWLTCVAAALVAGCHDGLLYQAAPPEPASVAISASIQAAAMGGAAEAYGRANRLFIRFSDAGGVRHEDELAFDPAGNETRVSVNVPLRDPTETLTLDLELRLDTQPLFRGSAPSTLAAGRSTAVEVPLQPVIARVLCTGPQVELASYGDVAQLTGAALFASDDTVRNVPLTWSVAPASIVNIGSTTGLVTALQDGTATVTCAAAGSSDTRAVRVFAIVRAIEVAPPTASIVVGGTQAFTATLRDARSNAINRVPTWMSANNNVATIDASGIARGVAAGTARIDATSAGVTGSGTLTVAALPAIALSAMTAAFTAVQGGGNPAPQTVLITNAGGGALTGLAASVVGQPGWLSATLNSMTAPSVLTLTVNSAGLAAGNHSATVNITSSVASNSPRAVTVTLNVAAAPPLAVTNAATAIGATGATLNASVNPNGNATAAWFEWGTDPALATFAATPAQVVGSGTAALPVSATLTNLGTNANYYFRAVASSGGGTARGQILGFTTRTLPAIALSATTAAFSAVQGGVNPPTQQIQITNGAGGTLTGLSATGQPGWLNATLSSTTAPSTLTLAVNTTGLAAGSHNATVNVASSVASNSPQTVNVTLDLRASTPIAATIAAASVGSTTATVNGSVNPNGGATNAWFEWGTSPTLTPFSVTSTQAVGSGTASVAVSAGLTNLATSTSYYFRAVASSSGGTSRGQILSFTTQAPPSITLSATGANFSAVLGGSNPAPQAIQVTNGGGGTLTGLNPNVRRKSPWLSATLSSTTAPSTLTLAVNIAGLPAGTYGDTVEISSPVANNSPRIIVVTLNVTPSGSVRVSVATGGFNLDPNGYTVTVAYGNQTQQANVALSSSTTFSNIPEGAATVTLSGLASNCSSPGAPLSRLISVVGGRETSVSYDVACAASSILVTPSSASFRVGASLQFIAEFVSGARCSCTWQSSNTAVASVSTLGVVTGRAPGTAIIIATSASNPNDFGWAVVTITP